jgi:hypothetical protein
MSNWLTMKVADIAPHLPCPLCKSDPEEDCTDLSGNVRNPHHERIFSAICVQMYLRAEHGKVILDSL